MTTEKHKAALDAVEERTENICKIAYDKKLQAEKRRRMIRLECVALTDEVIQALAAHAEAQTVGDDEVRGAVIGMCRIFDEYGVPFGAARKHLTTLERAATNRPTITEAQAVGDDEVREAVKIISDWENTLKERPSLNTAIQTLIRAASAPKPVDAEREKVMDAYKILCKFIPYSTEEHRALDVLSQAALTAPKPVASFNKEAGELLSVMYAMTYVVSGLSNAGQLRDRIDKALALLQQKGDK